LGGHSPYTNLSSFLNGTSKVFVVSFPYRLPGGLLKMSLESISKLPNPLKLLWVVSIVYFPGPSPFALEDDYPFTL